METQKFHIERNGAFSWVFRLEGSDKIIKRHKDKNNLIDFACGFIKEERAILKVYDNNGIMEYTVEFGSLNNFLKNKINREKLK